MWDPAGWRPGAAGELAAGAVEGEVRFHLSVSTVRTWGSKLQRSSEGVVVPT